MGLQTQNFQLGGAAVGTQMTQANSGMVSVNPNGSAAATLQNLPATDPIYGRTKGVRVTAGAGTTFDCRFNAGASVTEGAAQYLIYLTGAPTTADCDWATIRGTMQNTGQRLTTAGNGRPLANGSVITGSSNYDNLGTGKFILVDHYVKEGTTTSNGTVKWRWWDLAGAGGLTTPDFSMTPSSAQNTGVIGTDVIQTARLGKLTSGAVMPDFYLVDFRFDDTATDYLATPTFLADELENDAEPDVTHRVTIDFTGAYTGGSPPIDAVVTQTDGPTITLVQDSALLWHFDDISRTEDIELTHHGEDSGSGSTTPRTLNIGVGTGPTQIVRVGPYVGIGGVLK